MAGANSGLNTAAPSTTRPRPLPNRKSMGREAEPFSVDTPDRAVLVGLVLVLAQLGADGHEDGIFSTRLERDPPDPPLERLELAFQLPRSM